MGNSLGAQLLKAGLINKKQVNKAKQDQYKNKKKQRGKSQETAESRQLAQKALAAEKKQTREMNSKRQQQEKQKEIQAQISQMIESSKITVENGELTYNFADNNKLKKIYVTKSISDQLSTGQLAIVKHKIDYEIIPVKVARKIAERNNEVIIVLHKPAQEVDNDDPYADFQVPDDLVW